ncbi:centromere protein T isoform 2-T2 [Amazona ochrocephala]
MYAFLSSARRSATGAAAGPSSPSATGATGMPARCSSACRSTTEVADEVGEMIREETRSDPGNKNSGRTTLMGPGPLLYDVIDDTPRTLMKKIIHLLPPASPVVPGISKHEEPEVAAEEGEAELPTGRPSSMEEMELPGLLPEERPVFTPFTNKERKQLEFSEFERAVSQQLVQNQALSLLDSPVARSLSMSLDYLVRPDTVERRPLRRRAENRKPLDIKAFEDKVEQDMLRRKAQSYLVDSEMSPGSQATMLTSVGTENKQDHSQWTNPVEQLSVSEEVVVGHVSDKEEDVAMTVNRVDQEEDFREGAAPSEEEGVAEAGVENQGSPEAEREIAQGIGAGSLSKHSNPTFSEKSGMEPLKDAVEQADELEDQAVLVELDSLEEKPTEDEAEDAENGEDFMKTPSFVRAAAYKQPLLTPSLAKPAAPKPSLKLQQAKPVLKYSRKKPLEPKMSSSFIRVFKDYAKMPVATESFRIVEKCTKKYFKQLWNDLAAFSSHAGRKTIEVSDVEVLMRRQKLVTDEIPLHVLIERHLPLDYRKLLIPVAVSGNKVIPEIKRRSSHRRQKDA